MGTTSNYLVTPVFGYDTRGHNPPQQHATMQMPGITPGAAGPGIQLTGWNLPDYHGRTCIWGVGMAYADGTTILQGKDKGDATVEVACNGWTSIQCYGVQPGSRPARIGAIVFTDPQGNTTAIGDTDPVGNGYTPLGTVNLDPLDTIVGLAGIAGDKLGALGFVLAPGTDATIRIQPKRANSRPTDPDAADWYESFVGLRNGGGRLRLEVPTADTVQGIQVYPIPAGECPPSAQKLADMLTLREAQQNQAAAAAFTQVFTDRGLPSGFGYGRRSDGSADMTLLVDNTEGEGQYEYLVWLQSGTTDTYVDPGFYNEN